MAASSPRAGADTELLVHGLQMQCASSLAGNPKAGDEHSQGLLNLLRQPRDAASELPGRQLRSIRKHG